MDNLGQAMNSSIEFPYMRAEILNALKVLCDPERQRKEWVGWGYLDLYVHILYDDTTVIPNPEMSVSSLLYESEVPAFQALDAILGPMIDDLGDAPDQVYLADPRWPAVIHAAADALAAMEANEP